MEKLVDSHIRDEILVLNPLHRQKFVYQSGKSTETALRNVIAHTEDEAENKEVKL